MRVLLVTMLALLTIAPIAAAQEETNETRPDDAAWVEDCPPDMMCAADAKDGGDTSDGRVYKGDEPVAYGNESCIECSGPSDGAAEPGQALGPEDCIDCMQPPTRGPADGSCEYCRGEDGAADDTAGGTCMDGADETEICDRDVQYLDGGNGQPVMEGEVRDPADTGTASARTNSVPGASFAVVVGAFALAIFLLARRA